MGVAGGCGLVCVGGLVAGCICDCCCRLVGDWAWWCGG